MQWAWLDNPGFKHRKMRRRLQKMIRQLKLAGKGARSIITAGRIKVTLRYVDPFPLKPWQVEKCQLYVCDQCWLCCHEFCVFRFIWKRNRKRKILRPITVFRMFWVPELFSKGWMNAVMCGKRQQKNLGQESQFKETNLTSKNLNMHTHAVEEIL